MSSVKSMGPSTPRKKSIGVYSTVEAIGDSPTKERIGTKYVYDNATVPNGKEMYTKVNKLRTDRPNIESKSLTDETIMCENDELYTTNDDIIVRDHDDIIMCENGELYETTGESNELEKNKDHDDNDSV